MSEIFDVIGSLSPVVAIALIVGYLIIKWWEHKQSLREESEVKRNTREIAEFAKAQAEMAKELSNHIKQAAVDQQTLTAQIAELVAVNKDQLRGQNAMTREMVRLSASMSGDHEISADNAKLIIQHQWMWCRDETFRILSNSLANNHFRGNEEVVARTVQRAWKRAGDNAKASLRRYRGLQYPIDGLFGEVLPVVWQRVWKRGVPLYYMDRSDPGFRTALDDLEGAVAEWFDAGFDEHTRAAEDIDSGELYQTLPGVVEPAPDQNASNYMTSLLKAYKPGGAGLPSEHIDIREEFRSRLSSTPTRQLPAVKPKE